jgi:hypothetical protein
MGLVYNFVKDKTDSDPEFRALAASLGTRFNQPEAAAKYRLVQFAQTAARLGLDNRADPDTITHVVHVFLSELEGNPAEWFVRARLDGVWIEGEPIVFGPDLKLRPLTAADFESETMVDLLPFGSTRPQFRPQGHGTAILEFSAWARDQGELNKTVETVAQCLRLFQLGSVQILESGFGVESFLRWGFTTSAQSGSVSTYRYGLNAEGAKSLDRLYRVLSPFLSGFLDPQSHKALDPLYIALRRYNEALLQSGPTEGKMTSAMTCLEALFLKSKERDELSHRLGQRLASLLKYAGIKPFPVYQGIQRAYDMRSTFIHGSQLDDEQTKELPTLLKDVLEWSRVALLIECQLKSELDKDRLIGKLDASMLEQDASREIAGLIQKSVELYPPKS